MKKESMKQCPHCQQPIPHLATVCMYCGEKQAKTKKNSSSGGVAAILLGVAAIIILNVLGDRNTSEKTRARPTYTPTLLTSIANESSATIKVFPTHTPTVIVSIASESSATFPIKARLLIISYIEPNKLGIDGDQLQVESNPVGDGVFVYDPRTRFNGVERLAVWWVTSNYDAYALNSPSKLVTPSLKFPQEEGVSGPPTNEVVGFVFSGTPMNQPTATPATAIPSTDKPFANANANLRAGPGTNYEVVGGVTAGDVLDIANQNEAGDWYKLADDSWIAAFLVNNAPLALSVANVASNPAPNNAPSTNTTTAFPPGTYIVGRDITPGIYQGTADGKFCSWQRLSGLTGDSSQILAIDIPQGQFYIDILPTDFAVKTGCALSR